MQPLTTANAPTLDQLFDAAREAEQALLQAARENVNVFLEYVMKDPANGRGITQAPHHIEWQRLCAQNKRLIIWSAVEQGKTQNIIIGRTLWLLGRDPGLRLAIVGATHTAAQKLVRTIATYIEQSPELHAVFPNLQPDRTQVWTDSRITVKRPTPGPDPSLVCFGTGAQGITGSRWDGLLMDDILSYDNTRTAEGRKGTFDWIMGTLIGRLTDGAFVTVIGNAFHPEDALHKLAAMSQWVSKKFPCFLDDGVTPRWPAQWSAERIEARRNELPPHEFARQMLCQPRSEADAIFKQEWIAQCMRRGISTGHTKMIPAFPQGPPGGYLTVTGVDLAISQKASADWTAIFTILIKPNNDREVLWAERGKWSANEIVAKIIDTHRRYNSFVVVENNAGQDFLRQMVVNAAPHMPIAGFTTTSSSKNHMDYGVAAMSGEFAQSMWVIPTTAEGIVSDSIGQWISEMQNYDPKAHTGDLLMASWLAREGIKIALERRPEAQGWVTLGALRR